MFLKEKKNPLHKAKCNEILEHRGIFISSKRVTIRPPKEDWACGAGL